MFRDDKHFLPLQAADMLAWLFRMASLCGFPVNHDCLDGLSP
jgi:hypothetical protein